MLFKEKQKAYDTSLDFLLKKTKFCIYIHLMHSKHHSISSAKICKFQAIEND